MKKAKPVTYKVGDRVVVTKTRDVGKVVAVVTRANGQWLKVDFSAPRSTPTSVKFIRPGAVTKKR